MPGGPVTFDKGTGPISKPASVRQALPAVGVAAFAAFGGILYGELLQHGPSCHVLDVSS